MTSRWQIDRTKATVVGSGLPLAIVLAGAITLICPQALAQEPVIVGGSGLPPVEVDLGVLEGPEYGYAPAPTQRRLRMPGSKVPPSGRIVLTPPKGVLGTLPRLATPPGRGAPVLRPPALTPPARGPAPPSMAAMALPKPKPAARPEPPPRAKKLTPVEAEPLPAPPPPPPIAETPPPKPPAAEKPAAPPPPSSIAEAPPPPKPPAAKKPAAPPPPVAEKPRPKPPLAERPAAPPPPPPLPEKAPPPKPPVTEKPAAPPPSPPIAEKPPPPSPPLPEKASPPPPPVAEKPAPPPPPAVGEPEPGPAEVAALPPATAKIELDKPNIVEFAPGAATLDDRAKGILAAVAEALLENPKLRLQIVAYAAGGDDSASQARRLSLSRALAVRSHLIDKGVRSTRMDVRALGNKFEKGPGDRVDLILGNP